jgi:hypothetical protein
MKKKTIYGIIFVFFLLCSATSVIAKNQVIVDFYYSETCGSCIPALSVMDNITLHYSINYSGTVIINKKEVSANATNRNEMYARNLGFPSVIINNETRIPKANITYNEIKESIDEYIAELHIHKTYDENLIDIPGFGTVNVTRLSLPILTVVLAGLDSFNPCSFFILIFLLNLLVYLQSKRRMLLVGGVFIFFSGLFYFLFMFVMFNTLLITTSMVSIVSLAVGIIALSIGLLNMKDFFWLKKGPSLGITTEKQSLTFKKIRKLIKSPSLVAMLGATVFLAVSVNFYELLCTLGFPLIYTTRLTTAGLSLFDYYLYIIIYNIIYVIPLLIILIVFTFTLGKMKLSTWQLQRLKLFSGILLFSFGLLFIIDYMLLENVLIAIALPLISIGLTIGISFLWKKYKKDIQSSEKIETIHQSDDS